jgi:hypothetical protein
MDPCDRFQMALIALGIRKEISGGPCTTQRGVTPRQCHP